MNILKLSQDLRKKMKSVYQCIQAMNALVHCAKSNDCLERVISHHGASLDELRGKISEFNTLMRDVSSWSVRFTSHKAYFLFPVGRAYAAYQRMFELIDEFAPLIKATGEIDAYLAIAQWYNSGTDHAPRCLVRYNSKELPQIHASNMWDPLDRQDKVVLQDATHYGHTPLPEVEKRNILLALTCGVTCAQRFTITPHMEHLVKST